MLQEPTNNHPLMNLSTPTPHSHPRTCNLQRATSGSCRRDRGRRTISSPRCPPLINTPLEAIFFTHIFPCARVARLAASGLKPRRGCLVIVTPTPQEQQTPEGVTCSRSLDSARLLDPKKRPRSGSPPPGVWRACGGAGAPSRIPLTFYDLASSGSRPPGNYTRSPGLKLHRKN